MARLLLFAQAREIAGRSSDSVAGSTVAEVLAAAVAAYGDEFAALLECCRVWVNGDEPPEGLASMVGEADEVAIIPPVSGG